MCGRYVSATPPDELAKYFGATAPRADLTLPPNHNVAPTQTVYAVRKRAGARSLDPLHWGLVPFWASIRISLAEAGVAGSASGQLGL